MREFLTDSMADHIRNKLTQINLQQLTSENCYEVWLKIRILDMALDVPKEQWVTQHDVTAHIGVMSNLTNHHPKDFEKVVYQTLMVRAHESETPPSIANLVALYLRSLFKKSSEEIGLTRRS